MSLLLGILIAITILLLAYSAFDSAIQKPYTILCIDNVEYIALRSSWGNKSLTPHLKPSGLPYLCDRKENQ